jgi:hypothetical protein
VWFHPSKSKPRFHWQFLGCRVGSFEDGFVGSLMHFGLFYRRFNGNCVGSFADGFTSGFEVG